MRWTVRRWASRVLLLLCALAVPATMGVVAVEDGLGGSLFLAGVVLFVAAALLHCRGPRRLPLVLCGFGLGFVLMQLLILAAIVMGPHQADAAHQWGWRDAALGIGMALMMSAGTLSWSLGTEPARRAAGWCMVPLVSGTAVSVFPLLVVHERAAAVTMAAALVGAVLSEVFPAPRDNDHADHIGGAGRPPCAGSVHAPGSGPGRWWGARRPPARE